MQVVVQGVMTSPRICKYLQVLPPHDLSKAQNLKIILNLTRSEKRVNFLLCDVSGIAGGSNLMARWQ